VVALGLALLTPVATPAAEPTELNGTWVEQIHRPTREEHPSPLAPRDPARLVIDGHQFKWTHGDRTSRQSLAKFVHGQAIKSFDLTTVVGDEFWLSRAIYKVEGDVLTICESGRNEPRPTEFRRWRGLPEPLTALTTYKRMPATSNLKAGDTAPTVEGIAPDGSPLDSRSMAGKVVLLTFWRADDAASERHFAKLRKIRREFIAADKLQMVTLRMDGDKFSDWLEFLDRQAPLDPEFPVRRIYDDAKWWHYCHASVGNVGQNPFGVGSEPESFVIGPDSKLLAVRVRDADLTVAVAKALKAHR
jgi:uncharacterized protein (TIGR03067 family)